jgi:hypothetical protein
MPLHFSELKRIGMDCRSLSPDLIRGSSPAMTKGGMVSANVTLITSALPFGEIAYNPHWDLGKDGSLTLPQ